jgi:hypothetical protein
VCQNENPYRKISTIICYKVLDQKGVLPLPLQYGYGDLLERGAPEDSGRKDG